MTSGPASGTNISGTKTSGTRTHSALWREYAGYFRGHRAWLAGITVAGATQSFTYLPFAALLRHTFDTVLPARDLRALWLAILGLLAIQLTSLALGWAIGLLGLRASQDMIAGLRRHCLDQLYRLPRDFHVAADAESLHVAIVYETNWIDGMNNAIACQLLPSIFSALVLFVILFWYQPSFAVIIAVAAPALFVVNRLMVRRVWFRQDRLRQSFESFSRGVRFVISAIDLTRAAAAETVELNRQERRIQRLRRDAFDLNRLESGQRLLQTTLILAGTLAVLLAGGWAAADNRITRGELMSFYIVSALFATQARALVDAIPAVRMGARAFRKVAELLGLPHREPYSGTEDTGPIETVSVEHAAFSYPGREPTLRDATFTIHRGDCTALLGSNGSGKSTLLFLIAGLYKPGHGGLSVNGIPYDRIDMRLLRSRIAIVPQNPFLFAGTILDNVRYGLPDATLQSVKEALRQAGAEAVVDQLPDKLNTRIGENGIRLSGGQRQRLVIARALLRCPDLLILDEPTNHLDDEGIADLLQSLGKLPFRPAILMISHESRVLRHTGKAWRLTSGRLEPTP